MSLMDKMLASGAGSVKTAAVLSKSAFFNNKTMVPTDVPIINIALSSKIGGGLVSGLTFLAGPSKHFKSLLGLVLMRAYLKQYPDAVALFYDCEFGITPEYIEANGIDSSRVVHIPIEHIEQLKFDLTKRLNGIDRGDKVFIFIDSTGNLSSKKEAEDALEGKSVADMTRAKALKSLWRIVTPTLTTKDLPCVAVNHTYETQELYSRQIMSGGCLEAGTKIILADESLLNIEDVEPGMLVKTLMGPKEVKHVWDPETLADGTPECFEIEFEDGTIIVCSDAHKFIVDGLWIEAENLIVGMDCQVLA